MKDMEGIHAQAMKKTNPKLVAVIGIDFSQGYAGTQYLLDRLGQWFDVSIFVPTTPERRSWYGGLAHTCHVFPFWGTPWGEGRLRIMSKAFRILVFLRMLLARHLLVTETAYLREAAWAKKLRGQRMILAQFCQELFLPEEYPAGRPKGRWSATQRKYASSPDIVIDVDPFRARIREQAYGLARTPYVLRNTFPLSHMPPPASRGELWKLAGIAPPPAEVPVLVHAGGVGIEKPLDRIIDAIAEQDRPIFLLAFCAAPESEIQRFRNYAARKLKPGYFHLRSAVAREQLRARLWEADIGVVDYSFSAEPTANQKYCAPTKLYEFMACGLAILGSNNDSLRDVIERENIGRCARGDGTRDLAAALTDLLDRNLPEMKARARAVFAESYSYEKICDAEIAAIAREFLRQSRRPAKSRQN